MNKSAMLRLRETLGSLSNTEQQIARFILENPERATGMTVRRLADATFSSPSSVVRVCRSIGFEGYKEFRHALLVELAAVGTAGVRGDEQIRRGDSVDTIMDKVIELNIRSIEETRRLLSTETVAQCIALLHSCRTILLYGIGSSLCVAKDAYLKFLRLNKPCIVNEDWHSQLLQARNSGPQDVGIVFSYSGQTVEMVQCIEAMKANGTPVIAVTRYSPSPVARLADYRLYIAANESLFRNGAMSSRLAQLSVVDILYTGFANSEYEDCLRQLTKTHIQKPGE